MTYDDENRLLTYNGKAIRYDADGNMTYGPVNGVMTELVYDCRNRLVSAGEITYFYDAENNRIAMENGEYREEYVTDMVSSSLSRVLMSTRYRLENDKAEEPMLYIYGSGLIYEYSRDIYLYHHYNNLGSTMKLTDDFGDVVASYTYGVYGELLSGDTGLTRFLYNGRCGVTTDDNGLYYMRQRYYNPEIKRFVNQDILTGSMGNSQSLNRYSYVQGNPVSYTDPFGISPLGGLFTGTGLVHGVLGLFGLLPGIPGAVFNGIDAWVYATIDKDYFMATMAGLSAVTLGMGSIAKWAGVAAKAGTRGAKAFGYMATIGSCMSNGIEFAQNGIQTAVVAYDAWNVYTQTGSADAGTVAGVGLSALATIWSGVNLSKSSKEFGKMLKEDGVTSKIKQSFMQLVNDNRGCVDLDALGELFGSKSGSAVRYRVGKPVTPTTKTLEMALKPELYAYEIANKYGINLKGSGQKINIVYNPDLVSAGKMRMANPNVIELGPGAFVSEEELANTIAHELNHARSFLKGGDAPEEGITGAYHAGDTLAAYIRGEL